MIEQILSAKYEHALTELDIYENKDSLILSRIEVSPKSRNLGIGSTIMQEICDYADSKKQIIVLTPSNDFGGDKNRLVQFYKRFGFVRNVGYHKSFLYQQYTMIRYPKILKHLSTFESFAPSSKINELNFAKPKLDPNRFKVQSKNNPDFGKRGIRDENAPSIEQSQEFKDLVIKHNLLNVTTPLQRSRNTVRFIMPTGGKISYTDARSYVLYPNGIIRSETLENRHAFANKNFKPKHQAIIERLGVIRTADDVRKMIDRVDKALTRSKELDRRSEYISKGGSPEEWNKLKKMLRDSPKLRDLNDKTGLFN